MNIISTFNPFTSLNTSFDMTVQQGGHLLVINESSANLVLMFGNGGNTYAPANDRRLYCINGQMAQPHTVVSWVIQSQLPNMNIVNQVLIEIYQPGENVPEVYPAPLVRNTSVAGAITATSLNVAVAYDPAGITDVIQVSDPTRGNVTYIDMTNAAAITLGSINPIINTIIGYNPRLEIIQSNSNTTYTGYGFRTNVDALVAANIISVFSGANNTFNVSADGIASMTTANFTVGSLTRLSTFTASVTTTPTLFNHGLGVIPDIVIPVVNGTAAGTFTCIYDVASMTTTQVKLTGSASFVVTCLALKK
jgi:hypothetical protein